MSNGKTNFKLVCEQLDIPMGTMESDPAEFIKIVHRRAMEVNEELKKKNTMGDIEAEFKSNAFKKEEAKEEAQLVYDQIMDILTETSADALAVLLPKFSEMIAVANNQVRSIALRSTTNNYLNKKQLHLLYVSLKRTYDLFVDFQKAMGNIDRAPMIPALTGNYGSEGHSVRTFYVYIDDMEIISPYTAARMLGLNIKYYMDIIDIIDASDGTINGKKVSYRDA